MVAATAARDECVIVEQPSEVVGVVVFVTTLVVAVLVLAALDMATLAVVMLAADDDERYSRRLR